MPNNSIALTAKDIFDIEEFAKEKRRNFDIGMLPIGDNIFKLIRKEKIYLISYPVEIEDDRENNFSAIYVCLNAEESMSFIGLNTADYYDKQIFALAHELYHHFERCQLHVCRLSDEEQNYQELKANRFAAEFLLPTDKLEIEIKGVNSGEVKLDKWKHSAILRFIARLHCEYRLPYKAIVRRLEEIGAISKQQYDALFTENAREQGSDYYSVGLTMNANVFQMLNQKTQRMGVEGTDLEDLIRNYEDEFISLSELKKALNLFNKKPSDFGIEEENQAVDDLEDLMEYLEGTEDDEAKHC